MPGTRTGVNKTGGKYSTIPFIRLLHRSISIGGRTWRGCEGDPDGSFALLVFSGSKLSDSNSNSEDVMRL